MKNLRALACVLLVACGERAADAPREAGGTLVISTIADPGTLFPPLRVTIQARQIDEQIYDYLAAVGPELNVRDDSAFRPVLADRWRWSSDSLMLAFHINPKSKWHDGKDVTARDIQFTFALNKNPALGGRLSTELEDIDSVTVTDSLTAVFWFHRRAPTQFLDAAAEMLILPAHQLERIPIDSLREAAPSPIGTGRFRYRKWDRGSSVEIVADSSNYRGRARLDRVIWIVSPEFTTAVTKLLSGSADLFDGLRPENLRDIARKPNLVVKTLAGMDYAFLRFNLRNPANPKRAHPLFGSRDLRRAIAMSLNRSTLVRSVLDTFALVPVGPVVRAFPSTDPSGAQLPFDSARASRLLDSLGWVRRASDGIRVKQGKELAFGVIAPSGSLNRIKMGVLIQEQLRRMGIRVQLEQLETATQTEREVRGAFDASLDAWIMGSSPDGIKGAWTRSGIGKNGVNYGGYSNPRFDSLLDSALAAASGDARAKFNAAYAVINDDVPAVWLYEPRKLIGLHRRFRTSGMRSDAWWADLAEWSISPSERMLRDRLPITR